jgi:type II secretory pathway predicted ATPase ExeA
MDQHEAAAERRSAATATTSHGAELFTAQRVALGELMRGMDADARWVLLLGLEGSGKSTVVRALLDELRLARATVAVVQGRETADVDELVGGLRDQLKIPSKRKLLGDTHSVADIVANQSELRRPLVVVVDDADALSSASVKWLAGLAAKAARTESACYVVLAGAPELEASAGSAWAKGGSGGGSMRYILEPMTSAEVRRYVDQWRRSRSDGWIGFSEAAIERIETYAKGRPGVIGELCAHAVTLPSTRLSDQVSAEAVAETAERLGLRPATGSTVELARGSRRRVAGWVALVMGAATLAALLLYVGPTRVGSWLVSTSTAWLGLGRPADRSTSDVARSRPEAARSEPAVATERGRGAVSSIAPAVAPATRQGGEQRPAEKTPRAAAADKTPRPVAVPPSAQQIAALMAHARDGDVGELTRLVSGGLSPNVREVSGFTPLMAAVVNDRVSAARFLLDRGAEINARTRGGITALMLGIINDRPEAIQLLLERGAEVNAQSGAGWTALTFAVWKGDEGLVRTLLSHGAKPNMIDKQGWKPLDYAAPKLTPSPDPDARVGAEHESGERGARRPIETPWLSVPRTSEETSP